MTTTETEFARLTDSYRRELLAHCYRMLGSLHDAEDAVQETYLRAWRGFDRFEGRSAPRTWLYRIATNACLTAIGRTARRPLPSGVGDPTDPAVGSVPVASPEVPWLQPVPESALADPAAVVATRGSVRLAFVAALQHLPARQRAALLLRDVLAWSAEESAVALGTSTAAPNSALQRARTRMAALAPDEDALAEPAASRDRALLDRYVAAFESSDVTAFAAVLREDVMWEMPPMPAWFSGRDAVARFIAARVLKEPGAWRLVPTSANGQPAFAAYLAGPHGAHLAHGVQVLDLADGLITRSVTFLDPGLVGAFGLPPVLPDR